MGDVSTADELMGLVQGLRRVVRRRLRAELPGPALRGAQVELLQLVEEEPGVGVAAAARSLHLAGNTVSTLVNQLVAAGMVQRTVNPADRRAARLTLTDVARSVGLDVRQGAFRFGVTGDQSAMMGGGLCWLDYDGVITTIADFVAGVAR